MTTRPNTAAELARLSAMLEASMTAMERDRLEAKDQRDGMAEDIAAIRSNAVKIDNRVATIEKDMQAVKPVIAKVNSWQSMFLGAMIVLGLMGSAVTLLWETFREKLVAFFAGAS
jgi:hypothetical protein